MTEFKTKKKFGQNFLKDKNLLEAICDDAGVTKDEEVLEIGAGLGTLSECLKERAKRVFLLLRHTVGKIKKKAIFRLEILFFRADCVTFAVPKRE